MLIEDIIEAVASGLSVEEAATRLLSDPVSATDSSSVRGSTGQASASLRRGPQSRGIGGMAVNPNLVFRSLASASPASKGLLAAVARHKAKSNYMDALKKVTAKK